MSLPPLKPKQVQALVAMLTSDTDEEAIAKGPYAHAQFYRLKPALVKYKEWYLNKQLEETVTRLKTLSPKSVKVLGEQLDNKRNEQIRNKAANDILDRVLPQNKKEAIGVSMRDGDKEVKFVITRGE